jgi:hypothetical protein
MIDLKTTAQYWFSVEDLAALWHIKAQMVRLLLKPHRGRCHLARRGKRPERVLWIPVEVVRALDRERLALRKPAA